MKLILTETSKCMGKFVCKVTMHYLTVSQPRNTCDQLVDRAYWSQSSRGKTTFNGGKQLKVKLLMHTFIIGFKIGQRVIG